MTEYKSQVKRQAKLLKAEAWAKEIKSLHVHSLSSMWYDDRPQDTADGQVVVDKEFYSGLIERCLQDGSKVFFGKKLTGEKLVSEYERYVGSQEANRLRVL